MNPTYRIPSVDVEFMQAWSPARFLLLGFAGTFVVWVLSPLEYDYSVITLSGLLLVVLMALGFLAGCRVARTVSGYLAPAVPQPVTVSPDRMINLTLAIGAIGVAARVYDRVILRGFSVAATYVDTRETVAETLSPLSYIGGFGFSFGLVALLLIWLSSSQSRRPIASTIAVVLALYPMAETLIQGGRSTMVHSAFLLFMFARSSNAVSWVVRSKVAMAVVGVTIVVFAQLIYEVRSTESVIDEMDIADVFKLTSISRYALPPDWVIESLVSSGGQGLVAAFLKSWVHMTQYVTHSWAVWFENFEQFDGVTGWGRMHLHMLFRLMSGLYGEDLTYDPGLHGMEVGVSTTAFSAIYYDFGALSPLVAAVFGFVATMVQRKAIMYPERWLPLYVLLCLASLMWMIDNQLMSSISAFAVWSFAAYIPLNYVLGVLTGQREGVILHEPRPGVHRPAE